MSTIERKEKRPSRGPILLSGLVYPGLGQLVQRRWVAGVVFGVGFSALFCALMVQSFRVILAYYRLGLEGRAPDVAPKLWPIFGWFALAIAFYLANVVDAFLAHRRAARRSALHRHLDPELAAVLEQEANTGGKQ